MTRVDFMEKLERLLEDIPEGEREEVLQYYNDYLNEAGVDNEDAVIENLGSPEKIAASIKAGLSGGESGEFTETGYKDFEEESNNVVTEWNAYNKEEEEKQTVPNPPAIKRKMSTGLFILLIALCLIFSPVIISVVGGAVSALFGIIVAILAVVIALAVAIAALCFGLLIGGIALLGVGIGKMFVNPLGGSLVIAIGALCTGIGLLCCALMVWFMGKAIPAVIRFIVSTIKGLFGKKGGAKA